MENNTFINNICTKIKNGDTISPFLFLGANKELLNSQVANICLEILSTLNIPISYLFKIKDDNKNIKIDDLKKFLLKSTLKASYKCQIFLIENIGRFTLSSGNICLKFFEEPGKGNIIFLTNSSESQVLDTILSRVISISTLPFIDNNKIDIFYYSLIDNLISKADHSIFSYFFTEKLTKDDYIRFLNNIIYYSRENNIFTNLLFDLESDINIIRNNNVSAKYIVDKYIVKISMKN